MLPKPCLGLGEIFLQSLVLTPYIQSFSDFGLREELRIEEPLHGETSLDGHVDPEKDIWNYTTFCS